MQGSSTHRWRAIRRRRRAPGGRRGSPFRRRCAGRRGSARGGGCPPARGPPRPRTTRLQCRAHRTGRPRGTGPPAAAQLLHRADSTANKVSTQERPNENPPCALTSALISGLWCAALPFWPFCCEPPRAGAAKPPPAGAAAAGKLAAGLESGCRFGSRSMTTGAEADPAAGTLMVGLRTSMRPNGAPK